MLTTPPPNTHTFFVLKMTVLENLTSVVCLHEIADVVGRDET